jgi:hypothetical protein
VEVYYKLAYLTEAVEGLPKTKIIPSLGNQMPGSIAHSLTDLLGKLD